MLCCKMETTKRVYLHELMSNLATEYRGIKIINTMSETLQGARNLTRID